MRVGIAYDLKSDYISEGFTEEEAAEFDSEETIAGIEDALKANGHHTERIGNVRSLLSLLHNGKRWDIVFNICEGLHGIGREAQVPAVLDIYKIPYTFSDVLVNSLTLHKGLTKRVIRDLGIPTADFAVVENESDVAKIDLPFPLFAKPVAEGTGKGINPNSKITNIKQLKEVCLDRLKQFKQPVLVETFLPGREFTVGIVGTGEESEAVGLMEVCFKEQEPMPDGRQESKIYSYNSKANYQELVDYTLPEKEIAEACYKIALDAWKGLGCRDGGRIDLRMDKNGIPNFIEVNPLAGLNPIHSDLPILSRMAGISYNELIGRIMKSAIKRIKKK
jgi:D-alanine-D-alanine ligase